MQPVGWQPAADTDAPSPISCHDAKEAMSEDAAKVLGLWVAAYLIGAIPVSYLLAKLAGGIDLRLHGSGNVGASNLASQLGRRWWLPIAAFDMARGAIPIVVGQRLLGLDGTPWLLMLTPLFTILGNSWSPFLRLTGGRSVGVWAGGIVGISPIFFALGLFLYVSGWKITRRSAEWMLVVMALLPAMAVVWPERWLLVGGTGQMALFAGSGAVLIAVKRLASNGVPAPAGVSRSSVLVNRLLRDRDIADREQWLARAGNRGNNSS